MQTHYQEESIREITWRSVVLSFFLTILLGAANAYLGLKVGLTVSASIPAAVISMGILRFFRNSHILENNIVQTAASAGEALAAGVAFTMPALIILGAIEHFDYWTTVAVASLGGIFGVLFSIPLRRLMIYDPDLRFPEGTAIAKVLLAKASSAAGLQYLLWGALISGLISLCQVGLKLIANGFTWWFTIGGSVAGLGLGFPSALIGAGYIIGIEIGISILIGVLLGWLVCLPVVDYLYGIPHIGDIAAVAQQLQNEHVRFIGVGALLTGGLWSVFSLVKPLLKGLWYSSSLSQPISDEIPRTERDIPFKYVWRLMLFFSLLLAALLFYYAQSFIPGQPVGTYVLITGLSLILVALLGIIVSSIVAYVVGMVGSSASPVSGLTIVALIISALVIGALAPAFEGKTLLGLISTTMMIAVLIASAAAISNDSMQDLKTGHLVGATPWKQQVMLMFGVVVAALIIPLVLELLFQAYGIAHVFPRPGMDEANMLAAPQAAIMATLIQGVFNHQVPWGMLGTGICLALGIIAIDMMCKRRWEFGVSSLGVGMGIYLPLSASTPLVMGAVIACIVHRALNKQKQLTTEQHEERQQNGLLLACGIVAGASLMGIVLAIPFALSGSADVLDIAPANFKRWADMLGIASVVLIFVWFYRVVGARAD